MVIVRVRVSVSVWVRGIQQRPSTKNAKTVKSTIEIKVRVAVKLEDSG